MLEGFSQVNESVSRAVGGQAAGPGHSPHGPAALGARAARAAGGPCRGRPLTAAGPTTEPCSVFHGMFVWV